MNNGVANGLFAFNVNNAPSNANWNVGASQSCLFIIMPILFLTLKGGKIDRQKHGLVREILMSVRL